MRIRLFSVLCIAICLSARGNCAALDKSFTSDFYWAILAMNELNLQSLKAKGLVTEVEPLVFVFNGVFEENPHERESAKRIASHLGQPILITSNLPGIVGVPGVDAILFSADGKPEANIGLKTFLGATERGIDKAKGYLAASRTSVRKFVTVTHIAGLFGFEVSSEDGSIVPKKGTPDQKHRSLLVQGVIRLLGLSKTSSRAVWIVLDFSGDPMKRLEIVKGRTGENPIPNEGTFIDFVDEREADLVSRRVINIESLVARAGGGEIVQRYLFLLNREAVSVDASGIRISNSAPQSAIARVVESARVRVRLWCSRAHMSEKHD